MSEYHDSPEDVRRAALEDLCELLVQERDEARMVARMAYWRMSPLVMDLETGLYWHKEKFPWLRL